MKIAFDLYGAEPAKNGVINHGGGEYVKTVFDSFYKSSTEAEIYVIVSGKDDNILNFLKQYDVVVLKCPTPNDFQMVLDSERFDTLFCGLYVNQYDNIRVPEKTRFIITEHGLRGIEIKFDKYFVKTEKKKIMNLIKMYFYLLFPKLYVKYKVNKYLPEFKIKDDMHVVTVSNHSKYAIKYYYPQVNDIMVAYSPMKIPSIAIDDNILEKNNLEKNKYILMVNVNRGEKNCLRALDALDDLARKNMIPNDIKVVLTGITYNKPFKKYKNINIVKFGYVDSTILEVLYSKAHLFLYPTINEGFGYPPLEAMKYGTLVATSAVCSVPEVCGDSVMYFNPYDIVEIENRILQSFDSKIRNYYKSKISARLDYVKHKQDEGLKELINFILGDKYE